MATLTKQVVNNVGITPTYAAGASGGDNFVPDYDTFLHFKNTSGAPITVTIVTPKSAPGGQAIADDILAIPATTGDKMMGPYPAEYYADPANTVPGNAGITYSANPPTGLTVACIQVPRV
jgi:hypothetical protein